MHATAEHRAAPFDVLVLAGGRGSRLGGIDKAALQLAGERLVDRVVRASRIAGAARVIVIGPDSAGTDADAVLREEPEYAGPLAGIAAGIAEVTAPWVWVLACDLEYPERVCTVLGRDHLQASIQAREPAEADGTLLVDGSGRAQWLAANYRSAALASACAELGEKVANAPVRNAFTGLHLRELHVPNALAADIDTPQSLEEARLRAATHDAAERTQAMAVHLPPEALDEWLIEAAEELGLRPEDVSISVVLDVAKHVAHGVARPAAPLSTFLLGLALGRATAVGVADGAVDAGAVDAATVTSAAVDPGTLQRLADRLTARAARWAADAETSTD